VATPSSTTTYTVSLDDGTDVVTSDVTVTVYPVPATPAISQQGNTLVSDATSGNQWYDSNGPIPGAVTQVFVPLATDDYHVIVTSGDGCSSDPSNTIHFIFTGLREITNGEHVNIYPNPFNKSFTIDYALLATSEIKISIYNTIGEELEVIVDQPLKSAGTYRLQVNTSHLDRGIYYCKIQTNKYNLVKKLILSK